MASCPTDILPPVQIAESSELVGEVEDFTSLEREYAEDDLIYQAKIKVSLDIAWWRYVSSQCCIILAY